VNGGFERVAKFADEPHVFALDGQVRRVHLDQLPEKDPGPRVVFVLEKVHVGHSRPDQVVHELEFASDRRAQLFELDPVGLSGQLSHPLPLSLSCNPSPDERTRRPERQAQGTSDRPRQVSQQATLLASKTPIRPLTMPARFRG